MSVVVPIIAFWVAALITLSGAFQPSNTSRVVMPPLDLVAIALAFTISAKPMPCSRFLRFWDLTTAGASCGSPAAVFSASSGVSPFTSVGFLAPFRFLIKVCRRAALSSKRSISLSSPLIWTYSSSFGVRPLCTALVIIAPSSLRLASMVALICVNCCS